VARTIKTPGARFTSRAARNVYDVASMTIRRVPEESAWSVRGIGSVLGYLSRVRMVSAFDLGLEAKVAVSASLSTHFSSRRENSLDDRLPDRRFGDL